MCDTENAEERIRKRLNRAVQARRRAAKRAALTPEELQAKKDRESARRRQLPLLHKADAV
jgi:hypothetical protein